MRNSSGTSSNASSGIGFTGLLTITFIILKLTHVIEWSWLWVLSPTWISIALAILIILILLILALTKKP